MGGSDLPESERADALRPTGPVLLRRRLTRFVTVAAALALLVALVPLTAFVILDRPPDDPGLPGRVGGPPSLPDGAPFAAPDADGPVDQDPADSDAAGGQGAAGGGSGEARTGAIAGRGDVQRRNRDVLRGRVDGDVPGGAAGGDSAVNADGGAGATGGGADTGGLARQEPAGTVVRLPRFTGQLGEDRFARNGTFSAFLDARDGAPFVLDVELERVDRAQVDGEDAFVLWERCRVPLLLGDRPDPERCTGSVYVVDGGRHGVPEHLSGTYRVTEVLRTRQGLTVYRLASHG